MTDVERDAIIFVLWVASIGAAAGAVLWMLEVAA